jgi:hypothetical protein
MASTALLYAEAGTGKTLLTNSLAPFNQWYVQGNTQWDGENFE